MLQGHLRPREEVQEQIGGVDVPPYGTMIEIPRACLLADKMAKRPSSSRSARTI